MTNEIPSEIHYLYRITNKINGKIYIGQTISPQKRWCGHKNQAKKETPNQLISKAIKKYGSDNFEFEVIAICWSYEDANWTEEELIKQYDSLANNCKGYNLSLGGETAPKTEEWKQAVKKTKESWSIEKREAIKQQQAISAKQRIIDYPETNPSSYGFTGTDLSEESRKKSSETHKLLPPPNKGKVFSEEWRNNISKSHIGLLSGDKHPMFGKQHTKESKQKITETLTGYKHTEKAKSNMSKSKIGNTNSVGRVPWNKDKIIGCKFSDEQIQQMKTLREEGLSYEKIADKLGCNWKSVVKWTKYPVKDAIGSQ